MTDPGSTAPRMNGKREPLMSYKANVGFASLRPGKYEVAVDDEKVGTVWGDYRILFRAIALDGTVVGYSYPTPDDAAEALALHVAFVAVVGAETWGVE